ncbi:protein kinase domain containing protein [Stylonychia lemnae]|uniref:Protein kinase domain containing protein n=1 Tax=Stylonychia lemnae TaxID=5949 RepID=A0A078ARY5_STYLE|nr:protein kinase domain containing protein [Stylonychia lemnae]|eukprot:CDW84934.1 protein kinase domain containing protein [Stylonychia lemnae]
MDQIANIILEEHDGVIYRLSHYFEVKELLGKGGFGIVVSAYDKYKNEMVALKIAKKGNDSEFSALKKEAKILEKLRHPNIVEFKFVINQRQKLIQFKVYHDYAFLGLERLEGISLEKFIKKRQKNKMDSEGEEEDTQQWDDRCAQIMNQVLTGLNYVHSKNLIHRDLKPKNIVIDRKTLKVKIIDFGLAIRAGKDNEDQRCGTLLYQAPEQLFATNQYSKAVDMWASGIIIFELLTKGEHPILQMMGISKERFLRKGSDDYRDQYRYFVKDTHKVVIRESEPVKRKNLNIKSIQLMENLLSISQSVRYKSEEILQHPWLSREFENPIPESPLNKKIKLINAYQKLTKAFATILAVTILTTEKQEERPTMTPSVPDELITISKRRNSQKSNYAINKEKANINLVITNQVYNYNIYRKKLYNISEKNQEQLEEEEKNQVTEFDDRFIRSQMFSVNQTTIDYDAYNDETNLNVEEVNEETIGTIHSGFDSRLDMKHIHAKTVLVASDYYPVQGPDSNGSSLERNIKCLTRQNYPLHYQSLAILSPVKEVETPQDQNNSGKAINLSQANIKQHETQPRMKQKHRSLIQTAKSVTRDRNNTNQNPYQTTLGSNPTEVILSTINMTATNESISVKNSKAGRKVNKSPESEQNNSNFIQVKNNNPNKNNLKALKQQEKVRIIIQGSQAQQRKKSYKSDKTSQSPSPDYQSQEGLKPGATNHNRQISSISDTLSTNIQDNSTSIQAKTQALFGKSPKQLNPLKFTQSQLPKTIVNPSEMYSKPNPGATLQQDFNPYQTSSIPYKTNQPYIRSPKSLAQQLTEAVQNMTLKQSKSGKGLGTQKIILQSKSDDERKAQIKPKKLSPKAGYLLDLKKTLAIKQKNKSPTNQNDYNSGGGDSQTANQTKRKTSQVRLEKNLQQIVQKQGSPTMTQSTQSTKRYKSQDQEVKTQEQVPYVNLMMMQIKQEMKPFLQPIPSQKQLNQSPDRLQSSQQQQKYLEYQSFLKNASARQMLTDELKKLQENMAANRDNLKIQGNTQKIHEGFLISTMKRMSQQSRQK